MSAQHRKPFVAFVVLALAVVALIGAQRADAQHGRIHVAAIGAEVEVRGELPAPADPPRAASSRVVALGPAFAALADETGLADNLLPSGSFATTLTTSALERRVAKAAAPVGQGVRPSPRAVEARSQTVTSPRAGVLPRTVRAEQRGSTTADGSRVATSSGVRTPASSQASPRAQQAATGAAVGVKRDAARHRAPRGARPGRGR